MNILLIPASNSKKSINRALLTYCATLLSQHQIEMLDINDFEMPLYSIDLEEAHGLPSADIRFIDKIKKADVLLISYAEHNGSYAVAYKNVFDWASRADIEVYQGKPIVMLSTSPGPGGATSVLNFAAESAKFFNGNVLSSLSIPSFHENFDFEKNEILNHKLNASLKATLEKIETT